MSKRHYIIPIFVPHAGCPHDCVFCNQREITGLQEMMTPKKAEQIIKEYLNTMDHNNSKIEVAFYGGSFTGLDIKRQSELLSVAYKYCEEGVVDNLRLSTRPDYIDQTILDNLSKYNVEVIELGVQSLVPKVLEAAYRGHTVEDVIRASKLIRKNQFKLGIQLMPGLPESDWESMLYSAQKTVELGPDLVRIYPTLVIKDTYLSKLYKKDKFTPLSLEEAVEICKEELKLFRQHQTPVIRLGLQPSDGVNKEAVIAGPFHPAFRQLVESRLVLESIIDFLGDEIESDELILKVNPRFSSTVRGQKNSNLKLLQEKYEVEIKVKIDNNLQLREISINNDVRMV
ncbi:Radical SAM superfamily protein [Candidatus Frackibacter sp. WG12]|uniref:elongator complex protein 3 n=1 Tax=unclassified Candidatus Frackibacter TaxID=2648818 RepID=UPI000795C81D|nr:MULTISPECIES: radical SAM protein [unclassified Candidatus Frackibacter]KXS45470.1 MAG: radical SAM domain protein [Candidatus Frackibacter sp. T328-2]SDC01121.1 Radical SAM superfamily protein [Candidatus Frackibacter sp. WG11]SEM32435.1 Radical SAM superfamily protein [Candidatus Frackibacter sp. WG12]